MRKQKGFSLIELLIVVAIILIIAAIAIPNLLKSRIAANEASAVGGTRTIVTAELTYMSTNPETGYTGLVELNGAGLIDSVLRNGSKSGYTFAVTTSRGASGAGGNDQFVVTASPTTQGTTGNRYFCAVEDGVLKSHTTTPDRTTCAGLTTVLQ